MIMQKSQAKKELFSQRSAFDSSPDCLTEGTALRSLKENRRCHTCADKTAHTRKTQTGCISNIHATTATLLSAIPPTITTIGRGDSLPVPNQLRSGVPDML